LDEKVDEARVSKTANRIREVSLIIKDPVSVVDLVLSEARNSLFLRSVNIIKRQKEDFSMLNLRCTAIIYLVLSIALTACVASTPPPFTPDPTTTTIETPIPSEISVTLQSNNTFDLTAEQAQEVAVFIDFIRAYNNGRLNEALALLADDVGVSDCDYQNIKVITFEGKSQVAEWLQQHISDHDQLEISHIYDDNPDLNSGRHVLDVAYARRTSITLTKLGFSDGITPGLASKVIFTPQPTLIQSFANGPDGGDPELCRPGK
jgi:hypothetical protein